MQESQEMQVRSLGQEDPLKKEMTTHSSILARRIPWTEEPGGLQSMGSQRVEYDWSDLVQHKTKEFSALNSLKPLSYFTGHFLPYKSTFLYFFSDQRLLFELPLHLWKVIQMFYTWSYTHHINKCHILLHVLGWVTFVSPLFCVCFWGLFYFLFIK